MYFSIFFGDFYSFLWGASSGTPFCITINLPHKIRELFYKYKHRNMSLFLAMSLVHGMVKDELSPKAQVFYLF
jgi:hypothetical protein